MVSLLLAQDNGVFEDTPRLKYTYKTLYEIDSTLQTALSTSYLYNSESKPRYNTPSSTFARGNYLSFKLEDQYITAYNGVEALANLQDSIEKGESDTDL